MWFVYIRLTWQQNKILVSQILLCFQMQMVESSLLQVYGFFTNDAIGQNFLLITASQVADYPAMSFVFVCWQNKNQNANKLSWVITSQVEKKF